MPSSTTRLRHLRRLALTAVTAAAIATLSLITTGCEDPAAQVEQIIQQAQSSIDQVIATASGSLKNDALLVQQQIDHFSAVYNDDLTKTVDQLNDAAQEQLDTLMTLSNDVQSGITADIAQVTSAVQIDLDKLPGLSHLPEIQSFGPHYVVGGSAGPTAFSFKGDFVDAVKGKTFTPKLILCPAGDDPGGKVWDGGKVIYGETTLGELVFTVPDSDFPAATGNDTPVTYVYLAADYKQGLFSLHNGTAVAREAVLSVPPTVGTISLQPTTDPSTREITTATITTTPTSSGQPQSYTNPTPQSGIEPLGPDETIVPNSIAFHTSSTAGRWSDTVTSTSSGPVVNVSVANSTLTGYEAGDCSSDNLAVAQVLPQATTGGGTPPEPPRRFCPPRPIPGRVVWWLTYDVTNTATTPPLALGWGSQKSYDVAPSKWKLSFQPFPAAASLLTGPLVISEPQFTDFLCTLIGGNTLTVQARNLDAPYPPSYEGGASSQLPPCG